MIQHFPLVYMVYSASAVETGDQVASKEGKARCFVVVQTRDVHYDSLSVLLGYTQNTYNIQSQ